MTSRLDISVPATITVFAAGGTLSSLDVLPPGGIMVTDPDATGRLTVTLAAGLGARLSASASGGATVSGSGATLSVSGTAAQVNLALASLELSEPGSVSSDVLSVAASDPAELSAWSSVRVAVVPLTAPAFVAPPVSVTVKADSLDPLGGLVLSDVQAIGLTQMGLGRSDSLDLTLAVNFGLLLLPGFTDASGVNVSGLGTGTLELSCTADDIGALNMLLAGLEFAGPPGDGTLSYALRNVSGALPGVLTYGYVALQAVGLPGNAGTYAAGSQTLVVGDEALVGTTAITGTMSVLGNVTYPGAVDIAPDASLMLPYNDIFLGGTSLDLGDFSAIKVLEYGTLVIGEGANLAGPLFVGTAGLVDFSGTLVVDSAAAQVYRIGISLAAGAVVTGSGTLFAGNFSESGLIEGQGTVLAQSGQTLVVAAGSVDSGVHLDVASGGVMVLGPGSSLYGVFVATPLTIANGVTLGFLSNTGAAVSGIYGSTLGGDGGAFVINGPQVFSGTIQGMAAGDQLIFPGLTDFSLVNVTPGSFGVAGLDGEGTTVSYEIYGTIPAGTALLAGVDAQGDAEVLVRKLAPGVFTGATVFAASAGVEQPLPGLSVQLASYTTQSLVVTLTVGHGVISDGAQAGAEEIILTASSIAVLDNDLAALTYTGTGLADTLAITSGTGVLSGLAGEVVIGAAGFGTVGGEGAAPISEGQTALFGAVAGLPVVSAPLAAGALLVSGDTEFADMVQADGISGTALRVDGGASAIFNGAASVALGADITLGDVSGAGTLVLISGAFSTSGNITLAPVAGAAGSALDVSGALDAGGSLVAGQGGAALIDLGGAVAAGGLSLGAGGTVFAYGSGTAGFGFVADAGTMVLDGAVVSVNSFSLSGVLDLGGTASLNVTGSLAVAAGTLDVGLDATLRAGTVAEQQGSIIDAGILVSTGVMTANGFTDLAGGTLMAPSLSVGGVLAGYGVVGAARITNSGTIIAEGGLLLLGGSVTGAGTVEVGATAAVQLVSGLSGGGPVVFLGKDAVITLDDPARAFAGAENMQAHDAIDLVGAATSLVSYSGGTLTLKDTLGNVVSAFGVELLTGQPGVSIVSDGAGGALITLGDELPCFARGSRLLTPHGYRAVETLRPGDPVINASGASRPVRWVGRRTLDLGPNAARFALPVVIMPGAFGPGLPMRPLRLSPLHCVYENGVLIPVTHLVNGATILREHTAPAMTYFHIELDRHDILLAEGLACESYFDAGNRGALYQEIGRRSPARKMFAPVVTSGARLAAVRRRLHDVALAAGYCLTYWPVLHAVAAGATVRPEITRVGDRRLARFALPAPVRDITLLSSVACPADTDPDSEDRRELGVCLDADGLALGEGFYPRADADEGAWMGRIATLRLPRRRRDVAISLAAVVQSWVRPVG